MHEYDAFSLWQGLETLGYFLDQIVCAWTKYIHEKNLQELE